MTIRNAVVFTLFTALITGCTGNENIQNMTGWYNMDQQVFTANGQENRIEDAVQKKVYTDEYYAYTNMKEDSTASFGFGYYTLSNDMLIENNIFSTGMLDTAQKFALKITRNELGYQQEIPEIMINGIPNKLVETYSKINFSNKSGVDGVWKLTEFYSIKNGDTLRSKRNQYKIFQDGYFMFVQYYVDSLTNAKHKGFGFGNFELTGSTLTETNIFSSYTSNNGVPIQIEINKNSDTSYTQQIVSGNNNEIAVEKYVRMPGLMK